VIVKDQYYISGRGLVVTGILEPGEPWPRLDGNPVLGAMPDGSCVALYITAVESRGADKNRRPQTIGLNLRGFDKNFNLVGTFISFERRHKDRRKA
jgi:hypothetical protein